MKRILKAAKHQSGRTVNRGRLLRLLSQGPASRTQLAEQTGLSPGTVTNLTKDLIEAGLIHETKRLETPYGRPRTLLEFNADAGKVIGIRISRTRIRAALVNLAGEAADVFDNPLSFHTPHAVIESIATIVRQMLMSSNISRDDVIGSGVAVPGIVDEPSGVVKLSTVLGWREVPLAQLLEKRLKLPVLVRRNGNSAALAEALYGLPASATDLLYVHLGDGIGAGIVLGGRIYSGRTGRAGEIGHNVVDPSGPLCQCGNRGCLEAVASGRAIARQAQLVVEEGRETLLAQLADGASATLSAKDVVTAAKSGDGIAQQLLAKAGHYIGLAIAGLVNMLDIPQVSLGGGLVQAGSPLLDPITTAAQQASLPGGVSLDIHPSVLGPRAGLLGAASAVVHQFLFERGDSWAI